MSKYLNELSILLNNGVYTKMKIYVDPTRSQYTNKNTNTRLINDSNISCLCDNRCKVCMLLSSRRILRGWIARYVSSGFESSFKYGNNKSSISRLAYKSRASSNVSEIIQIPRDERSKPVSTFRPSSRIIRSVEWISLVSKQKQLSLKPSMEPAATVYQFNHSYQSDWMLW